MKHRVVLPHLHTAFQRSVKKPAVVGLILFSVGGSSAVLAASSNADAVSRGAYLVNSFGCADCHTSMKMGPKGPEPDQSRVLSGHPEQLKLSPPPKADESWAWFGSATNTAYAGPWGISYAANITSDKETGLGAWKEDDFVKAIKTGKHAGVGRPIMPPMPWLAMSHMTEDDLRAIFQYLQTVPPVRNCAPDYQSPAQ